MPAPVESRDGRRAADGVWRTGMADGGRLTGMADGGRLTAGAGEV
ncbi:hypothetical protein [Streptomyces stelliscabiei]